MEEEETNKKKLKKLKKRVKALAENQCNLEWKLDKLTEWLDDNIEQSEPEPKRTMDELRQVKTYGYTPPIEPTYDTDGNVVSGIIKGLGDEEYTHKIEELETILRKRGVDFNYQKHLEHLVEYSNPSSFIQRP